MDCCLVVAKVVKQEMARINIDILGINELKWMGMGKFSSDDYHIYYCLHEASRSNGVALIVNKRVGKAVMGYNLKKNAQNIPFIQWCLA